MRLLLVRAAACAPGSSLASSRKLRPLSGSESICVLVTTPPTWCASLHEIKEILSGVGLTLKPEMPKGRGSMQSEGSGARTG